MPLLVSYDIENDYLRQKIGNRLLDEGLIRIQYSVYLGTTPKTVEENLLQWLSKIEQHKNWSAQRDSILWLPLKPEQIRGELKLWGEPKGWERDDLDDQRHTLIF